MRDFSAAIGLVLAIEGSPMAGFTGSRRTRAAIAGRENPAKLRRVGLGAALPGVRPSGLFARFFKRTFPAK
jgi:hypothetical protein